MVTKRCAVCTRFRAYDAEDGYCIVCGSDELEAACACGRAFDYVAVEAPGAEELHCPRCGRVVRGRAPDYR